MALHDVNQRNGHNNGAAYEPPLTDEKHLSNNGTHHEGTTGPIAHGQHSHGSHGDGSGKDLEHATTAISTYAGQGSDLERKTMRKIDWRLVPALSFMYGCSLIDRTDLPNARLAGMDVALGTGIGDRYSVISLVFFITYVLFEIPANIVLKSHLLTPRIWLPSVTLAFGAIKIAMSASTNWQTLAGLRALLGAFEGALFPGCIFLISSWYPRYETQRRISGFYLGGQALGGFGSSIAYGWSQIPNTARQGWQWIFIMMGVLTCVSALIGYILVPDFPNKSTMLTAEQSQIVHDRINVDRHDTEEEPMNAKVVFKHLGNIRIWAIGMLFLCSTLPAYAFSYFLALILRGMGFSTRDSQLLATPPYIAAIICGMIVGFAADKVKKRGPFLILGALVSMTGSLIVGYATSNGVRYFGSFLAVIGCQSNIPTVMTWGANNVRGLNARAVSSAVIVGMGGMGGILATTTFRTVDAPAYLPGLWTTVGAQLLLIIIVVSLMSYFAKVNAAARRGERVLEGHPTFRYTL